MNSLRIFWSINLLCSTVFLPNAMAGDPPEPPEKSPAFVCTMNIVLRTVDGLSKWVQSGNVINVAALAETHGTDCTAALEQCRQTHPIYASCPLGETEVDTDCGRAIGVARGVIAFWPSVDVVGQAFAKPVPVGGAQRHYALGYGEANAYGKTRSSLETNILERVSLNPDDGKVFADVEITNLVLEAVSADTALDSERFSGATLTNKVTIDGQIVFHSVLRINGAGNLETAGPLTANHLVREWVAETRTWRVTLAAPYLFSYLITQLDATNPSVTNNIELESSGVADDEVVVGPKLNVYVFGGYVNISWRCTDMVYDFVLQSSTNLARPWAADSNFTLTTADLDGDGLLDCIASAPIDNEVKFYRLQVR
ncbi:MAG: hypothetical protein HYT43_00810 [Candidatus Taylorbacteria bacterium]|nr:hypothetical protein [Candidatus Taylorbacteria bacterium]